MQNLRERVLEAMKQWDVERLRSELVLYITTDTEEGLKEQFFDDIATEEEMREEFNG